MSSPDEELPEIARVTKQSKVFARLAIKASRVGSESKLPTVLQTSNLCLGILTVNFSGNPPILGTAVRCKHQGSVALCTHRSPRPDENLFQVHTLIVVAGMCPVASRNGSQF